VNLFKVLSADGTPAHGGTGVYPMPTKTGKPGAWTKPIKPVACQKGYHLTSRPSSWWTSGARVFVAEFRGAVDYSPPDKAAYESVRLIEEITIDWPQLVIFPEIRALAHFNLATE